MAPRGKQHHRKKKKKRAVPPYDPHSNVVRTYHLPNAVGFGETTAWRLRKQGLFPDPIKLTDTIQGWLASELAEWRRTRERARTGQG